MLVERISDSGTTARPFYRQTTLLSTETTERRKKDPDKAFVSFSAMRLRVAKRKWQPYIKNRIEAPRPVHDDAGTRREC